MFAKKKNGKRRWLIPDGYMGAVQTGEFVCHEAVCVLNISPRDAHIRLTFFFEDRPPLGGFEAVCCRDRTNHIRLDKLTNDKGEMLPRLTPYATLVESDTEIIVQASRLDVSQPAYALMTTIAY